MDIQNEIDKMLRKGQIDEAILRLNEQIQATATPCDRLYYLLGNATANVEISHKLELLFRGHGH